MGKVLKFTKLKIGEIVLIDLDSQEYRCEVLSWEGKNIYKVKLLEGPFKGDSIYFEMIKLEDVIINEQ